MGERILVVKGGFENESEVNRQTDADRAQLGYIGLEGGEIMRGIIVPEIDDELKSTYVDRPDGIILCGCGDDRACTHSSSQHIQTEFRVAADGPILRYFGGLVGAARVALVTLAAQHGEKGLSDFKQRNFIDIAHETGVRAKKNAKVLFALHSATGAENNEAVFQWDAVGPVACAYAANLGTVSRGGNDPAVKRFTQAEAPSLFPAQSLSDKLEAIQNGNRLFVSHTLAGRPDFSVSRIEFRQSKAPVMLLAGEHANASDTLTVNNLLPDKISDPSAAHDIGRPFYNNDTTQVAEAIIKAWPEYEFDPLLLLLAMDVDIRSTRAALTGGNPAELELQRYGDADAALEYLSRL